MISSVEDTQRLKLWHYAFTSRRTKRSSEASTMENLTESGCFLTPANESAAMPSLPSGTGNQISKNRGAVRRTCRNAALGILAACFLAGSGDATPENPAPEPNPPPPPSPPALQSPPHSQL